MLRTPVRPRFLLLLGLFGVEHHRGTSGEFLSRIFLLFVWSLQVAASLGEAMNVS